MSTATLRERIAAAQDIKREIVHSTLWDVDVEVVGMSGGARGRLMASAYDDDGRVDYAVFYPMLIIETVCDPETHALLFSVGDVEMLNGKSANALEEIALVAMRLSGLSKSDLASAEKNSAAASDSSTA